MWRPGWHLRPCVVRIERSTPLRDDCGAPLDNARRVPRQSVWPRSPARQTLRREGESGSRPALRSSQATRNQVRLGSAYREVQLAVAVVWLLAAVAVVERGLVERGLAERVAVAVVWLLVAVVGVAAVLASAWASA
jgi:hypothetical protein